METTKSTSNYPERQITPTLSNYAEFHRSCMDDLKLALWAGKLTTSDTFVQAAYDWASDLATEVDFTQARNWTAAGQNAAAVFVARVNASIVPPVLGCRAASREDRQAGEQSIEWAYFRTGWTIKAVRAWLENNIWVADYNGAGCAYQHAPRIRKVGSRILVTMATGLDV